MTPFESVLAQALKLDTLDKVRLIEKVTPKIEAEIRQERAQAKAYPSLWGACRGQGVSLAADEIDSARASLWESIPRTDIE